MLGASELRETARAAFAHYDTDGSGALDARELGRLVAHLGGFLTPRELREALAVLDHDGSGSIDEAEFVDWWARQSDDLDGDGALGDVERAMARLRDAGRERFRVDVHSAAWRGQGEALARIVAEDPEAVHARDGTEFGLANYPLHYAAYQGHVDACRALIDGGASVNVTNAAGCTPLFLAAQQSHREVVRVLIERGADIRLQEREHKLTAVDVCTADDILDLFRSLSGGAPPAPPAPSITVVDDVSLAITWEPPTTRHDQVAPISGYKIRLSSTIAPVRVVLVAANPTEATVGNLQADTEYSAQVAAINLHGISEFSAKSAPSKTRRARPPAPTNVVARAKGPTEVLLTWSMPPSAEMAHFVIQQCLDVTSGLWKTIQKCNAATRELALTDLFADHKYLFRIGAVGASPHQGEFSTPVEVRTRRSVQATIPETVTRRRIREARAMVAATVVAATTTRTSRQSKSVVDNECEDADQTELRKSIPAVRRADRSGQLQAQQSTSRILVIDEASEALAITAHEENSRLSQDLDDEFAYHSSSDSGD